MMKTAKILAIALCMGAAGQAIAAKVGTGTIPRAYWGEWSQSLDQCGEPRDTGYLKLHALNVRTAVGNPDVIKVIRLKNGSIKVFHNGGHLSQHDETAGGWTDISVFRLTKSGDTITETDMIGKHTYTYLRCPAAPK